MIVRINNDDQHLVFCPDDVFQVDGVEQSLAMAWQVGRSFIHLHIVIVVVVIVNIIAIVVLVLVGLLTKIIQGDCQQC